jgi:hypothetical protein
MIATATMRKALGGFAAYCVAFACAAFSSAAWAQAGYIHQVSGLVSVQKDAGKTEEAKAGAMFEANTTYRTGADGKIVLKFADGQVVALSSDSAVHIGQYRYDPANPGLSHSTVELIQGEMRFIAGLIGVASSTGVRVVAGDTMISMKPGGVDFTVGVTPGTQEVGYAVVARGEISARTPYGPISRVAAGQYAPWQPGRGLPLPMPFAAAPAVVQAAVAASWIIVLPASTPVEVATAARTAAAVAVAAAPTQAPTAVDGGSKLAGYVVAISNTATVSTSTGAKATPGVGTTFQAGAALSTGADGTMTLKFADGQVVVLGPNSSLAIAQYEFDPGNVKASKAAIDLVDGAMRVITGAMHTENHDGISISSGASIIDILNTGPADFDVAVKAKNPDGELGIARVRVGEISAHTPYGAIDRIKKDESAPWGPKKTADSPIPMGAGLALVESVLALQLPGLPNGEPVAIAAEARAAAATAEANRAQAVAAANPANTQLQAAAKASTELANLATGTANAASQAVAATIFASTLTNLPATAAGPSLAPTLGPALAQVAGASPVAPAPAAPTATVTPGAGGGCANRGSPC